MQALLYPGKGPLRDPSHPLARPLRTLAAGTGSPGKLCSPGLPERALAPDLEIVT